MDETRDKRCVCACRTGMTCVPTGELLRLGPATWGGCHQCNRRMNSHAWPIYRSATSVANCDSGPKLYTTEPRCSRSFLLGRLDHSSQAKEILGTRAIKQVGSLCSPYPRLRPALGAHTNSRSVKHRLTCKTLTAHYRSHDCSNGRAPAGSPWSFQRRRSRRFRESIYFSCL